MARAGLTVEKQEINLAGKLLNGVAKVSEVLGLGLGEADVDSMIAEACRSTGLHDLGDDTFRDYMQVAVETAAKAPFTPLAKVVMRQAFVRALKNRLRIEDYVQRHPEVVDVPIEKPIFVLGFPRTGTTVLQHLLHQVEGYRALEMWQVLNPVPVHPEPEVNRRKLVAKERRLLALAYLLAPEQREVHEVGATTKEECWPLFGNTFAVLNWDLQTGLEAEGEYLLSHSMTWAYREYRRMLQILVHQDPSAPRRLVLKCPEHLWFVDSLLEVFPDACVVWTHRDPVKSVASYCSLMAMQRRVLYGRFEPAEVGPFIEGRFLTGVERAMDARAKVSPARFFDVDFKQLVRDQPGMVRRALAHFGIDGGDGFDERMQRWLDEARGDERGKHRYSAPHVGLDADEVHERFSRYIHEFDIPVGRALPAEARPAK